MFSKIVDAIDLFRIGEQVANPAAWQKGGNIATVLPVALMAVVKLAGDFGYGIQLSTEEASTIGLGISSFILFVINNISSVHSGVLPAKPVVTEKPMEQVSSPDEASQPVVQADKSIHTPSDLPLVSSAFIEEAKAAAIRDRANSNIYGGA